MNIEEQLTEVITANEDDRMLLSNYDRPVHELVSIFHKYVDKHGVIYLVDGSGVEHNFLVYGYATNVTIPTKQKVKRYVYTLISFVARD